MFASGTNCSGGSGTAVALGDANGVLSSTQAYTNNNAVFGISTNAAGSASVVMKATNATLTSPIAPNPTIAALTTLTASSAGTPQFGVCFYDTASTNLVVDATYSSGSTCSTGATTGAYSGAATFIFPTAVTSPGGSTVASKPAGNESDVKMNFLGNISPSTPSGVYSNTLTFVATGTY